MDGLNVEGFSFLVCAQEFSVCVPVPLFFHQQMFHASSLLSTSNEANILKTERP